MPVPPDDRDFWMNHTPCPQEADVRYWPCAHGSGGYDLFQDDIPHTWPRQNVPALCNVLLHLYHFMIDGHFFTICRMPSNRSLYGSLILFQISLHNCPVASADTVTFQLFCQIPVSNIILHTNSAPVVSLSILWTIPGRITPLIPERLSPQCAITALTSVP